MSAEAHAMPTFVLNDENVNVFGFRILTSGIDLSIFRSNPVMYYNHQRDTLMWEHRPRKELLPIGRWENIRVEGGRLLADTNFDDKDEFAQTIKQKVEDEYINAASLGAQALATSEAPEDLLEGQDLPTVTKSLAFEASITDMPGNQNSLRLYNEKGEQISLSQKDDAKQILLSLSNDGNPNPQITDHQNSDTMKSVAVYLGLSQDEGENKVLEAIKQKDVQLTQKDQEVNQLKQQLQEKDQKVTELSNQLNQGKAEALVDGAISAGKITQNQRDAYLSLAQSDYDNTKKVLDNMSTHQPINQQLSQKDDGQGNQEWTFDDYSKKDPEKLNLMKTQEPEKYKELFRNKYGKEPQNV